tara:strand:- start:179 stop:1006 length:828 start_codon:yes stop_codon:yes gene_type:complete
LGSVKRKESTPLLLGDLKMRSLLKVLLVTASASLLCFQVIPVSGNEKAINLQSDINQEASLSQEKINDYDDEANAAAKSYAAALQRAESLTIYNGQLRRLIESQQKEIRSIKRQTEEIESIETGALPLMLEMTETLNQLIEGDIPFLTQERRDRVENLKRLIDRADVTAGEKYRRIMEAYLIEADYGRTIESYRGELDMEGTARTVDFLRVGRIGLYYQTLDSEETGNWDKADRQWEVLEDEYRRSVRDGLRIARKQSPPTLLRLPVDTPSEVSE